LVRFYFKGIGISITVEMQQVDYKDAKYNSRTRFVRKTTVIVHFWDFNIDCNCLDELLFIKSCLQYYMQCYWKRLSKAGSKIDFLKTLQHENTLDGCQNLNIAAKQKNNKHYLYINHKISDKIINEIYLDGQEVIMLDNALNKAINYITPDN